MDRPSFVSVYPGHTMMSHGVNNKSQRVPSRAEITFKMLSLLMPDATELIML